jgi:hypothetical protein
MRERAQKKRGLIREVRSIDHLGLQAIPDLSFSLRPTRTVPAAGSSGAPRTSTGFSEEWEYEL